MAIYTSPSRRRARTLIVAAACLVIGVVGGLLIGRATVTTTGARIDDARAAGEELATRVEALTIEYEQAIAGQGDTVTGGVLDALAGIRQDATAAADDAPWLSASVRGELDASLRAVADAADAGVDPAAFAARTSATATTIRATFGVA
jgi:hypothetical protein